MWGVNQPSGPEETWPDKMMHSCDFRFTDLTLGGRSQGNGARGTVIREQDSLLRYLQLGTGYLKFCSEYSVATRSSSLESEKQGSSSQVCHLCA